MEKFKAWINNHKAMAGVLLGLVLVAVYYLYKKMSGDSNSENEEYQAAGMVYNPASPGGTGSGDNSQAVLEAVKEGQAEQNEANKGFFESLTSTLTGAFSGISDVMAQQNATMGQFMQNISDSQERQAEQQSGQQSGQFSSLKDIIGSLSSAVSAVTSRMATPTVTMPDVPSTTRYKPEDNYTKTKKSTGSDRGGKVVSSHKDANGIPYTASERSDDHSSIATVGHTVPGTYGGKAGHWNNFSEFIYD